MIFYLEREREKEKKVQVDALMWFRRRDRDTWADS